LFNRSSFECIFNVISWIRVYFTKKS